LDVATNVHQVTAAPRIEVLAAARRHWFVALVPVVLLVAAAVVLGMRRPVTYTTTANLSVGHVYVSDPAGIPTIVDATQSLAAVYSRAISAEAVVVDARQRLKRAHVNAVSGSLSATPIPDSPLIRVTAKSQSAAGAVALADAGAEALTAYVNAQVRDNNAATTIARRYLQASVVFRERRDKSNRAARRYADHRTAANKARRDRAAAATDTAQLQRDALGASYQQAVQGGTASTSVEIFSRASQPTSDRVRMIQLLAFVGLLGGLAAGAALALLRTSRDIRRNRL
jgi:uncharacterized protein involved in exopolysaccharide biosynthesis